LDFESGLVPDRRLGAGRKQRFWPGGRPQIILFCGRPTASGDVSGAWIAGQGQHSAWQIDESNDLAPGRVFVSDAGCWMVGQVFNSESGFRR